MNLKERIKLAAKAIIPERENRSNARFRCLKVGGRRFEEDDAMSVLSILTCVRVLAESIAAMPLDLYKLEEDGDRVRATEHPLYMLMRKQANPYCTAYELRLWMIVDGLLRGFGAAQVVRDDDGKPVALYPLHASKLSIKKYAAEYIYEYRTGKEPQYLRYNDVLLIKTWTDGGLLSSSLISEAKEGLATAKATQDFSAEYFNNGSGIEGVIEVPSGFETDEEFEEFQKRFKESYTGDGNRHSIPILESGATFKGVNLNLKDRQFLETRMYQRSEIAGLFRVPAPLINDLEKANLANVKELNSAFLKHTLRPWLANIEQRCDMTLLSDDERTGYFFEHNPNHLLALSPQEQAAMLKELVQAGISTPNEARRKLNMQRHEDGDILMTNGNMLPVKEITKGGYRTKGSEVEPNE